MKKSNAIVHLASLSTTIAKDAVNAAVLYGKMVDDKQLHTLLNTAKVAVDAVDTYVQSRINDKG